MSTGDTFRPAAFVCRGCDRRMWALTSPEPPADRTCNLCRFAPGWFRDPVLRALCDPHDAVPPARKDTLQ